MGRAARTGPQRSALLQRLLSTPRGFLPPRLTRAYNKNGDSGSTSAGRYVLGGPLVLGLLRDAGGNVETSGGYSGSQTEGSLRNASGSSVVSCQMSITYDARLR